MWHKIDFPGWISFSPNLISLARSSSWSCPCPTFVHGHVHFWLFTSPVSILSDTIVNFSRIGSVNYLCIPYVYDSLTQYCAFTSSPFSLSWSWILLVIYVKPFLQITQLDHLKHDLMKKAIGLGKKWIYSLPISFVITWP